MQIVIFSLYLNLVKRLDTKHKKKNLTFYSEVKNIYYESVNVGKII